MDPALPPTSLFHLKGDPSFPCRTLTSRACNQTGLLNTSTIRRGASGTHRSSCSTMLYLGRKRPLDTSVSVTKPNHKV